MRYWKLAPVFVFLSLCTPISIRADGVFLEGSLGFFKSNNSQALFISYQRDSCPIIGLDSFYEVMLGSWNGGMRNNIIALSRGIRWNFHGGSYVSFTPGGAYVTRTSSNMGTHLQFAFDFALGTRTEKIDLSIGFKHFSNGRKIFHWTNHSNDGENFITLRAGFLF